MKTLSSKLLFYVKKKYTQISSEGAAVYRQAVKPTAL